MTDDSSIPTQLLQARTVDNVSELLRRCITAEEVCARLCISDLDELWRFLGVEK